MIITKKALARRTFLRGAGAALALPFLDAMAPALAGPLDPASNRPVRLGFVYVPNGVIDIKGEWTPAAEGAGFEFTSTLQALEPFRERLLVLSGLAQANGRSLGSGGGDHARAGASWLTGAHPVKTEGAGIYAGVSADQIAARELGKQTELASLEIGLEEPGVVGGCDSGYSCAYTNTVSWRTPTTPAPVEDNPRMVFERLFGDSESTNPTERLARLKEQRTVLDFVKEDLSRLSSTLGSHDRNKLEEYLEAVRDVERRIDRAEAQKNLKLPVLERPGGIPDNFEDHAKLMMDLQVLAYQTDMTRVVTFMMGREGSDRSYPSIGVPDAHHPCTHHQNDPEKIEKTRKINEFHVQTFAYMLDKMRSMPDGDGTLLDHSMIVYGSSIGDGNEHTHHDLPIVLAGGGAGRIKGGRHLRYPKDTPMNNLLLSLLDKMGVQPEKLGDATGKLDYLSGV